MAQKQLIELDEIVVKFVGDSGDGMQLTGSQFTDTSALVGNDLATFPDFPAEIRAPKGTIAGVSGFQVHIGNKKLHTPGDTPDVLVVMNAAALKANIPQLTEGKTIIVDTDGFKIPDLKKAKYESNPLEDGSLENFNVIQVAITSLTKEALKDSGLHTKDIVRSKNMFALGIVYWLFSRPMEPTINFIKSKFKNEPDLAKANIKVLETGFYFAETVEALPSNYKIAAATLDPGKYRNITGNQATAWGLMAAAEKSGRKLFFGSYPITPASDILHELSKYKYFDVKTFQAEDEIAAISSAIGASFAGNLGVTSTSGPGLALKGEALGFAVMAELPLILLDIQRGGPSTGLPTKTEQSDLLMAMHGRSGESPLIIIASSTPTNCFDFAFEAARLSLEHMTPVIFLSDGYLGNGASPWKIPQMDALPKINPPIISEKNEAWQPYQRDEQKLSRYWAIPGTPQLEHRLGGLEKSSKTGNISYEPQNHEEMVKLRAEKVKRVEDFIPLQKVEGAQDGDLLVIGWGGTYGSLLTAVNKVNEGGHKVGLAHFNYMNPLPKNTQELLGKYKKILVCELNTGQFASHLRSTFGYPNILQYNKIQGLPFTINELTLAILNHL